MATATKLTYEDLVEGEVSQHDVLGLLAAGEVEVDAVARYLALLESKNGQNGGGAHSASVHAGPPVCLQGWRLDGGGMVPVEILIWRWP